MRKKKYDDFKGLTVEYRELGTISIDELAHALIEDVKALKDLYNIRFVKGARLLVPATNEYGEPVGVNHP